MYNRVNKFKGGRISNRDEPRSGRPVEAVTPEIIEKIHDMILNDRRVKLLCEVCRATRDYVEK